MQARPWRSALKKTLRQVYRKLYRLWGFLAGWKKHCPVCDNRVPRFKPFRESGSVLFDQWERGGFDVANLPYFETLNLEEFQCSANGCGDRERLYALFIRQFLARSGDRRTRRLVDFAPSHNFLAFVRAQGCFDYRRADLFRDDVDDRVDLQDMQPYSDESFDCFICSHVLEHVPDDRRAMRELHRILKPDGWGIVMVPLLRNVEETDEDPGLTDPLERVRRFAQDDHVRLYTKADFLARLEAAGFAVRQWRVEDFGREEFERCGISENSVLYVVTKPPVN